MRTHQLLSAPFTAFLYIFLLLLAFTTKLSAQVTTNCDFPTEEPTLCDLYEKDPPAKETVFYSPTSSSSLSGDWIGENIFINTTFTAVLGL